METSHSVSIALKIKMLNVLVLKSRVVLKKEMSQKLIKKEP